MTGIKEIFQGLVADGVVSQEPTNYDAATLKIYIAHLEAENAALRERLKKAVETEEIERYARERGILNKNQHKEVEQ